MSLAGNGTVKVPNQNYVASVFSISSGPQLCTCRFSRVSCHCSPYPHQWFDPQDSPGVLSSTHNKRWSTPLKPSLHIHHLDDTPHFPMVSHPTKPAINGGPIPHVKPWLCISLITMYPFTGWNSQANTRLDLILANFTTWLCLRVG